MAGTTALCSTRDEERRSIPRGQMAFGNQEVEQQSVSSVISIRRLEASKIIHLKNFIHTMVMMPLAANRGAVLSHAHLSGHLLGYTMSDEVYLS